MPTPTGNAVSDNLVMMVFNRTQDTRASFVLIPEIEETLRVNQFAIDHLAFEITQKDKIIAALLKPHQK